MKKLIYKALYLYMVNEQAISFLLQSIEDIIDYPHVVLLCINIACLIVYTPLITQDYKRKYFRL